VCSVDKRKCSKGADYFEFVSLNNGKLEVNLTEASRCENITWNYIYMGQNDTSLDFSERSLLDYKEGNLVVDVPNHDFVEATCTTIGRKPTTLYLSQITERPEVTERSKKFLLSQDDKPMNVILIGWDSASHAQFERRLKKTLSFMIDKLEFTNWRASLQKNEHKRHFVYELDGYNAVGDGTTINLAAMLTGTTDL
jgi:hypothetical protein